MQILNLTPHELTFVRPGHPEGILRIPPSGTVAWVAVIRVHDDATAYQGVPVALTYAGAVEGLPDPSPVRILVVSQAVAAAVTAAAAKSGIWRNDVLFPDDLVRNEDGQVVGARALGRVLW